MTEKWMALDQACLLPTYDRLPIVVEEAKGMYITDVAGQRYLDLFSGLAVNVLGHCHEALLREIACQASRFSHISNYFYNQPALLLAEKLINSTFKGKIFFTNSGAESTEAALKYIHKYGQDHNRRGIIVFKDSFHGRTLGALKLTRMASVQQDFPTVEMPVYELSGQDLGKLDEIMLAQKPAALLFEPISGSGGINVVSEDFIEQAAVLCNKHNVLLCLDEIQTGMGRTGKLFAYQHTSVIPDMLLFAKGVGGGLPLGGILVKDKMSHYFKPGDHGTTFAPNPIAASLGRRTLELLEEGLLASVQEKEAYLVKGLRQLQQAFPEMLGEIRGKGLMLGVVILQNVGLVKEQFMERRILVNMTNRNILRLLPSIIIEKDHMDEFLEAFTEILTEWKDTNDKL